MKVYLKEFKLESPIEEDFVAQLLKYVPREYIKTQQEYKTKWGTFRVDIVLDNGSRKIGLECDGKDFHDEYKDEIRDGIIMGENYLDDMYRLKGKDIYYHYNDCLFLLSKFEKEFFTSAGLINLETLASENIKHYNFNGYEYKRFTIDAEKEEFIILERRWREGRRFWKTWFDYASKPENIGKSVDNLAEQYANETWLNPNYKRYAAENMAKILAETDEEKV